MRADLATISKWADSPGASEDRFFEATYIPKRANTTACAQCASPPMMSVPKPQTCLAYSYDVISTT